MWFFIVLCLLSCFTLGNAHEMGTNAKHQLNHSSNDCGICLSPVMERKVLTDADRNTIQALPCGHYKYMHNKCLQELIIAEMDKSTIRCPLCRNKIILNENLKNSIHEKRMEVFVHDRERVFNNTGVSLKMVLKKWPRILDIGNIEFQCTALLQTKMLECAYHVLLNPTEEDRVSGIMEIYENHPEDVLHDFIRDAWPGLIPFEDANVYEYYGQIISLGEAMQHSLKVVGGKQLQNTLMSSWSALEQVSKDDIANYLMQFPQLMKIPNEKMRINGVSTNLKIKSAALLMQTSLLHTNELFEHFQQISKELVFADSTVDTFIKKHWPHLASFQHIGRYIKTAQEHHTIHFLAKLVANPAIASASVREELDLLEEGAIDAESRLERSGHSSYLGMDYIANHKFRNAPGCTITIRTAVLYSRNTYLPQLEKNAWNNAINMELTSIIASYRAARASKIPTESRKVIHQA